MKDHHDDNAEAVYSADDAGVDSGEAAEPGVQIVDERSVTERLRDAEAEIGEAWERMRDTIGPF